MHSNIAQIASWLDWWVTHGLVLQMPISNLHDEILQITFECGTLLQQQVQPQFGSLVSHVTRRWRRLALATPSLWTKIMFDKITPCEPYLESQIDRAAAFLSRSMPLPVDVDIEGVDDVDFDYSDDTAPAFLQLITAHIGRCRRLSITDGIPQGITRTLTYFSFQAAPILNSIKVDRNNGYYDTWGNESPLFQLGAPHLTTADIDGIWIPSIPGFLEGLQHLTSLRISADEDWDIAEGTYNELRDGLMALPSLDRLDLTINDTFSEMASRLPMVLPTLHFLYLDAEGAISDIICSVQADALITLSLGGWGTQEVESTVDDQTESQFPSLQHLILNGDMPDLGVVARCFSKIKRLTVRGRCDLILPGAETEDNEGDGTSRSGDWERWPSLQVLAVAMSHSPPDLMGLPNIISKVKRGGHPIRTLMLPEILLERAGVDDVAELRKLVEVEEFSVDWPNPFDDY